MPFKKNLKGIRPLFPFPTASTKPLPVGEVSALPENDDFPGTHQVALLAVEQAMSPSKKTPDTVVMGITIGEMLTTKSLLEKKAPDPKLYHLHAAGSVTEDIDHGSGIRGRP